MGGEFGQWREWNHDTQPRLAPAASARATRGCSAGCADLNRLYRARAGAARARLRARGLRVDRLQRRRRTASLSFLRRGQTRRRAGRSRSSTSRRCRATATGRRAARRRLDGDAQQRRRASTAAAASATGGGAWPLGRARCTAARTSLADAAAARRRLLKPLEELADRASEAVPTRSPRAEPEEPSRGARRARLAWNATSASTATSTSRRARTRGSRPSRSRTRPTRTTTGTSASPPSATPPTRPRASSTARTASSTIVNNYARMSFNFGPTLLSWLERHDAGRPTRAVLEADRAEPAALLGPRLGDRPGLQPHDPAARQRGATRCTQVRWGIADFRAPLRPRAGGDVAARDRGRRRDARGAGRARDPLHDPRAAPGGAACAPSARRSWQDVSRQRASTRRRPYRLALPSGRHDRASSSTTARSRAPSPSSGCSTNGEQFARAPARRLLGEPRLGRSSSTSPPTARPTATTTATATWRSPTRSTRSRRRELRAADQLRRVPREAPARPTRSRSSRTPPGAAPTASSAGAATAAAHSGGHPGWNQAWRAPLRDALDWLRDALAPLFEQQARRAAARTRGRPATPTSRWSSTARRPACDAFLARARARGRSRRSERIGALKLLELQRHAHAHVHELRLVLRRPLGHRDRAGPAVRRPRRAARRGALRRPRSRRRFRSASRRRRATRPRRATAASIYDGIVRPARVDLPKVGAATTPSARSSSRYAARGAVYCYERRARGLPDRRDGRDAARRSGARAFTSEITGESQRLAFGVLHLGDHNVHGGVEAAPDDATYLAATAAVEHAFARADVPEVLRLLDAGLGRHAVP